MSADRVPFVGLTGGLGAGKSTALAALAHLGAAVLSTDQVVHDLYASAEVRDAVVERFGSEVAPGGVVDRRVLADRMFAGDAAATPNALEASGDGESLTADRKWVENLVWPRVAQRMTEWREELDRRRLRPAAAVVEVPLLFESGMEGAFDATIAVVADEALRSDRAGARGHAAVAERTARQLSQEEKAARATYVVANDGTLAELESALSAVLDMLRR